MQVKPDSLPSERKIDKMKLKKKPIRTNKLIRELAYFRKELLIQLLGGKCADCGGEFPQCAFDFHHTNENDSKFKVGNRIRSYSEKHFWEKVIPHVQEHCVLLCANCHRVRHHN